MEHSIKEVNEVIDMNTKPTITEVYYYTMTKAIGKNILDFTEEQELYNAIMSAKRKTKEGDFVDMANYIKQSFLNMCILLRERQGLTTDILKDNKVKEPKPQKVGGKTHTLEKIEEFVNTDTGNVVKDAIRFVINFIRLNINDRNALKDLQLAKLWSKVDTGGDTNVLAFADGTEEHTPKQVIFIFKEDFESIKFLNSEELYNKINIIWEYAVKNNSDCNDTMTNVPFYFEIMEELNKLGTTKVEKQNLMSKYIASYSYKNWLLGRFNEFKKQNKLVGGTLLSNKMISSNTENWGFKLK